MVLGFAFTEDEDEDMEFQSPLFNFEELLQMEELDGAHALMVSLGVPDAAGRRGTAGPGPSRVNPSPGLSFSGTRSCSLVV